jgi:hypothetical protein
MTQLKSILAGALLFISATAFAQSYKTAAGVRIGQGLDLSVQQYLGRQWTAEGIIHTSLFSDNLGFSLLAEKHRKIFSRNFNIYYGAGGHYYAQTPVNRGSEQQPLATRVWGLSAIGGAELSLGRLNLAVDFKPELHLGGDQAYPFVWQPAAVSVRYILEKRERRTAKDWKVWDRFSNKDNKNKKSRWE